MEHFITGITINKLHHLSNIEINLNKEHRQHLLLTGKNGSGKTSLLLDIQRYLKAINEDKLYKVLDDYKKSLDFYQQEMNSNKEDINRYECEKNYNFFNNQINNYCGGIELAFSSYTDIDKLYADGNFVTAFYPAERKANIEPANGVQEIKLDKAYGVEKDPGQLLLKYMVHLKTQQSYARNEGNISDVENIQMWFDRFERALRILLDEDSIKLQYDYKNYDFKIVQDGRVPFNFAELSDGYSSVIYIVSDLILRMDKNWLNENRISQYTEEGIVLIDELETHLHIELQKKILPFLTEFFPHIQFIVTTHSPYILNSVANAKAYDLEKHMELDNLYMYKADDLAEGYFDADDFSNDMKKKIAFRKEGYFGTDEKFVFIPLDDDVKTKNTVKLLHDAYYGTTSQKKMEARIIRKHLRENISDFKNYVREYIEAVGEDKEDLELLIQNELSDKSEFTAFKRWLVRDSENLPELKKYL